MRALFSLVHLLIAASGTPGQRAARGLHPGKGRLFRGTVASLETRPRASYRRNGSNRQPPQAPRRRWRGLIAVVPIGALLAGGFAFRTEIAAFVDSTVNPVPPQAAIRTAATPRTAVPFQPVAEQKPSPREFSRASAERQPPAPAPRLAQYVPPPMARAPMAPAPMPPAPMPPAPTPLASMPSAPMPPAPMPRVQIPGMATRMPPINVPNAHAGTEAVALRGRNGHFAFDTAVNGATVPMLFDTGASFVSLRAEDAGRLGIDVDRLSFSGVTSTANGTTHVAPVILETLTIGPITVRNVAAVVAQKGALPVNLLGQSFMKQLAGYDVDGNRLTLRGR